LPDPLDPDPAQTADGIGRQTKGSHRQLGDGIGHTAGNDDRLATEASDSPCRSRRVGDGGASIDASAAKPTDNVVEKGCLAAKKVRRAADLDLDGRGRRLSPSM
jgi:hypothetical protein